MYTSSTHTTTIITDQYDATNRIRIEDDLPSTYRQYYKTGAVQADVAMSETYQFHVDILTANMENEDSLEA